jgi:tRNA(Arg) A34 adenosine deaminase TadA
MDAGARKQRISQVAKRLELPLSEILLLRKGLSPVPYCHSGILLADSARLYFANSPEKDLRNGSISCTSCDQLLEDCVWRLRMDFAPSAGAKRHNATPVLT